MDIQPPPPAGLADLIDAYAVSTGSVLELASGLSPEQAAGPTDCPGWSVLDQVLHVLSVEQMLLGAPVPEVDVSSHAHVRHDFGRLIETYLEGVRGLPLSEVVEQLRETRQQRLAVLGADGVTAETEMDRPFGRQPVAQLLGVRVFDIWCHEQDLREALAEPGGWEDPAASHAMSRLAAGLPKALCAPGGLEHGEAVAFDISGPVSGVMGVRVAAADGRRRGAPVAGWDLEGIPTRIALGSREFARGAAGRWAVDRLSATADITGDRELAGRALATMVVTP